MTVSAAHDGSAPWLQTPQTLSQDEFAIITLGTCMCEDKDACKELNIPMFSSPDKPLIVKGTMHQLGGKDDAVPVSQTTIVCVTAFRDEVGEAAWQDLSASPIKFCLANMQTGNKQITLATSPGRRSYQKDKAKVQVSHVSSTCQPLR